MVGVKWRVHCHVSVSLVHMIDSGCSMSLQCTCEVTHDLSDGTRRREVTSARPEPDVSSAAPGRAVMVQPRRSGVMFHSVTGILQAVTNFSMTCGAA